MFTVINSFVSFEMSFNIETYALPISRDEVDINGFYRAYLNFIFNLYHNQHRLIKYMTVGIMSIVSKL